LNGLRKSANLNKSYFTNRQDRYIHFKDQPVLADYCFSFLKTVATFSYQLLPPTSPASDYRLSWPDAHTSPYDIQESARKALSTLQSSIPSVLESAKVNKDDVLVFPIIQAGQFNIREEEQCLSLLFNHLSAQQNMPPLKPLIDLTSGYFALYKQFQDHILQSTFDCRIVVASPKVLYYKAKIF
jgi:CDP-diacylglycerol--glycerol-3-phosphate 3-phosphatidyltransferase